ncbi:MAG TPA: cytochrome P450, partial [Mycobacteriales bacterium]
AAPSLTPHRVAAFRPAAEQTATRLLASLDGAARIELMADFAHRFSFEAFCDLFGIESAARADLFDWVSLAFSPAGRGRKGRANLDRIERFVTAEVERRLYQPGDDVLSAIVTAWAPNGEVGKNEVISLCASLLLAGFETTPQMIGMSVVALLTHPDELAWLRADLSRVSAALDELLRFNTPGPSGTLRVATEDIDVAGTVIPAGDRVLLSIDATNHDPADHEDPHRLNLRRPSAARHITFGLGPHYCPGSALARMQLTVALTALLRRYPYLALATPVEELPWRGSHLHRGLAGLPLDTGERCRADPDHGSGSGRERVAATTDPPPPGLATRWSA